MKSKETPTNGSKRQSYNKLGSQIGNVVVRAIIKYNERNKIYNSYSLQSKQIIAIKIILFIVLFINVNFFFLVFFLLCFFI